MLPCQQARYADPDGLDALVRRFSASAAQTGGKGKGKKKQKAPGGPGISAVQMTELSDSAKLAHETFLTTRDWFGGCREEGTQLLGVRTVTGVGDEATMLTLRTSGKKARAYTAAIARTGQVTTATVTTIDGSTPPDQDVQATLLAAAVNALCGSEGAGTCAAPPRSRASSVPPTGAAPGMLSELDLPPVRGTSAAWIGTEPRKALANVAATQCDVADFTGMSNALTRTFVLPEGKLPLTFGLTETVGTLPRARAAGFVDGVERKLGRCEDKNLGTTVTRLGSRSGKAAELHAWRLEIELTDTKSATVYMGIIRSGTAVAQVGFTPVKGASLSDADFRSVLARAQVRLAQMPPPTPAKKQAPPKDKRKKDKRKKKDEK